MANKLRIPFTRERQLCEDDGDGSSNQSLPGWPSLQLSETDAVWQRLRQELWANDLEQKAHNLWILTTPSSASIHALHEQKVRDREIVITEDPRLHLVWSGRRIFVKPIPVCLLSHRIWHMFLAGNITTPGHDIDNIRKAALGFLRSYRYLIQHKSDLAIAQQKDLQLVPTDIKWDDFSQFMSEISFIQDSDVSPRYHYGELRLSRLNLYSPLLFQRRYYIHMPVQYAEYFTRLYGPVLVAFTVSSTMLNSMQVALAAPTASILPSVVGQIFYWYSIVVLILVAAIISGSCFWWLWMIVDEWVYTISHEQKRRKS